MREVFWNHPPENHGLNKLSQLGRPMLEIGQVCFCEPLFLNYTGHKPELCRTEWTFVSVLEEITD